MSYFNEKLLIQKLDYFKQRVSFTRDELYDLYNDFYENPNLFKSYIPDLKKIKFTSLQHENNFSLDHFIALKCYDYFQKPDLFERYLFFTGDYSKFGTHLILQAGQLPITKRWEMACNFIHTKRENNIFNDPDVLNFCVKYAIKNTEKLLEKHGVPYLGSQNGYLTLNINPEDPLFSAIIDSTINIHKYLHQVNKDVPISHFAPLGTDYFRNYKMHNLLLDMVQYEKEHSTPDPKALETLLLLQGNLKNSLLDEALSIHNFSNPVYWKFSITPNSLHINNLLTTIIPQTLKFYSSEEKEKIIQHTNYDLIKQIFRTSQKDDLIQEANQKEHLSLSTKSQNKSKFL